MSDPPRPEPRWLIAVAVAGAITLIAWAMLPVVAWMIGGYP